MSAALVDVYLCLSLTLVGEKEGRLKRWGMKGEGYRTHVGSQAMPWFFLFLGVFRSKMKKVQVPLPIEFCFLAPAVSRHGYDLPAQCPEHLRGLLAMGFPLRRFFRNHRTVGSKNSYVTVLRDFQTHSLASLSGEKQPLPRTQSRTHSDFSCVHACGLPPMRALCSIW